MVDCRVLRRWFCKVKYFQKNLQTCFLRVVCRLFPVFHLGNEAVNLPFEVLCLSQQFHEGTANDGALCVLANRLVAFVIADARAHYRRMLQLHGLNASKIIQLKVAESLLSPGYRCRGNHVEEAVAVGIELAHPFFGGLRGDEENITDAVALEKRPIFLQVVFQWQVRSEEHTSELQSRPHLVCRLLLEKK